MNDKLRNMTAVYILCKEKILLLYKQRGRVVNHTWVASAGGHFEAEELNDPLRCVLRELKEELGLTQHAFTRFDMRYVALYRINGEIRQNYYFFAEMADEACLSSSEGDLHWFDFSQALSLDMPYTAKYVVEHYLSVARHDDKLYGGIADGEKIAFTPLPDYA